VEGKRIEVGRSEDRRDSSISSSVLFLRMTWIAGNIVGDYKISTLLWSPGILSASTFAIYLAEWAHILK